AEAASPATGVFKRHAEEQARLGDDALAAGGGGMAGDMLVPSLGESVTEATIAKWLKRPGEAVAADDPVVELETDKVTLEIGAPAGGTLGEILANAGATVTVGAVIGRIEN